MNYKTMNKVGVCKETYPGERRVALVPSTIPILRKAGLEVYVERGAGMDAGFTDDSYRGDGATLLDGRDEVFKTADIILQVLGGGANPKVEEDIRLFRPGQVIIGLLDPLGRPDVVERLASKGVIAFALELLPRIAKTQAMDALTSQANVAGYKSVIIAAEALPRMLPMMFTAAGNITSARVFVIGAGVAGLQAIATARRLGAVVHAYDVRLNVKEQVESLGARFEELPLDIKEAQGRGGYARVMDEGFYLKQRELMARVLAESDIVITTASVPGKRAPILITAEMVKGMHSGSIIVDLASERGGNCELTRPGEVVEVGGVKVIGALHLASTIPYHASQMYSNNITNFLLHLIKDGRPRLDMEDEIIKETLVCIDGRVVQPKVLGLITQALQCGIGHRV